MAKPEKIQELQASLACTLMLPLEKIQIDALYSVTAAGTRTRLPIDPRSFAMSSNGETGCFLPNRTATTGPRRLRLLQATGDHIQVDYTIVEPPQEITELSMAQLSTILASSPVMTEMSASVGGTGVEAAAPAGDAAPAPSSGAESLSSSATPLGSMIAYGVGAAGGFTIFIAIAVMIRMRNKQKETKTTSVTEVPQSTVRVIVLDNATQFNPLHVHPQLNLTTGISEYRIAQDPRHSRV